MKCLTLFGLMLALSVSTAVFAKSHHDKESDSDDTPGSFNSPALKDAVIVIIRHAEKPASGYELSAAGEARAQAYAGYFQHFTLDGQPVKFNYIFAAADSKESQRPRLTITPTSLAIGITIDSRFKDKDFQELANEIRSKPHGQAILISWHHGEIPSLMRSLGANPAAVIPKAKWPEDVFGWLIELRYNADGRLIETRRIKEKLIPDDSNKHSEK